jgi:demethylmenaquinone methyltransferase/2-methoxy-6-polyprenyl-1,4-benzoquinol methylase
MSYVYMKVLESAPERYDRGMRILTLGRLEQVYRDIAERLSLGSRVLDVGCGTASLAMLLAKKGCNVTGIDVSASMLARAGRRVREAGLTQVIQLLEIGAVDLDSAFPDASFDAVVSTLTFSEMSGDEIDYALAQCRRILRSGGQLLIADEVMPSSSLGRAGAFLLRLPFVVAAFVLTQNTTRQVRGLRDRMKKAGFATLEIKCYLAGTLKLFVAEKAQM